MNHKEPIGRPKRGFFFCKKIAVNIFKRRELLKSAAALSVIMISWGGCHQNTMTEKPWGDGLFLVIASDSKNEVKAMDPSRTENEILIKFKPGTSAEAVAAIARRFHLKKVRASSVPDLYLFERTGESRPVSELIEALRQLDEIEYAEPNYERAISK